MSCSSDTLDSTNNRQCFKHSSQLPWCSCHEAPHTDNIQCVCDWTMQLKGVQYQKCKINALLNRPVPILTNLEWVWSIQVTSLHIVRSLAVLLWICLFITLQREREIHAHADVCRYVS